MSQTWKKRTPQTPQSSTFLKIFRQICPFGLNILFTQAFCDFNFVVIYALFWPNSNSQIVRVDKKIVFSMSAPSQRRGAPLHWLVYLSVGFARHCQLYRLFDRSCNVCARLHCTALNVFQCIVLYCIASLNCTVLPLLFTALLCAVLHCMVLYCTSHPCTAPNIGELYFTMALYYT